MPASPPLPSMCQQHTGRSMVSVDLAGVERNGFTRHVRMLGDTSYHDSSQKNKMSPILSTLRKSYLFPLS